ncbi:MAG TPA: histidine kinase dimerization/phosphoacceptor domain -containing protein [Afifellaceae bacterium]|nr:histidine kinase dimerization/phosphoacceptor domain -containing protein [Afifellaceae bacterium]
MRFYIHPVLAQILFAVFCTAVSIGLRFVTDFWLPGAGPFALTIPAVLVATLFGRWLSGVIAQSLSSIYAWYFVLPIEGSFEFAVPEDGPRVVVNMAAGFFVVALAEMFRRAVRQAIADLDNLMMELEHRVKNNFASIAGMLRMQMRNEQSEQVGAALQTALGRVEQFARAHGHLYRDFTRAGTVNMRGYLSELCRTIEVAHGGGGNVRIVSDISSVEIDRDRAITFGLIVNEVATNSFKHAFGDRAGTVSVRFGEENGALELVISDDGSGMPADERREGSMGLRLVDALAQQVDGTMQIDSGEDGTTFRFEFRR